MIPIIHKHIMALNNGERNKLDLFIYSRGGDSDTPWAIVSMFREYAEKGLFNVLIPYRAHSAATVIAVGADEIVMTKKAELGPIDITMPSGPYNPTEKGSTQKLPVSVEDVMGYFSLLKKVGCETPDQIMAGFELLTKKVHPLALGQVSRLLEKTKLVAVRLLNTRADPFEEKENEEIVERLSSKMYSHSHAISRTEAIKYIGLNQVKYAEECKISDDLWSLYEEYDRYFGFNEPFVPDQYLIEKKMDEYTWNDVNLSCIESLNRFDNCKANINIKRLKQIPPNLNLSGINLPHINIPQIPQGMNQAQFNGMIHKIVEESVQQGLNNITRDVIKEFINSMPQAGFETSSFGYKWVTEA